jgi:uncharacterized protein (TIGR02466 family)
MNKRSILPLDIYEFNCKRRLLVAAINSVNRLEWVNNDNNLTSARKLNCLPQFHKLHTWFATCLELVRRELGLPFEKLKITQSWANKTTAGQSHHGHVHPNSYLSGIFYLTTSMRGKTVFSKPNEWFDFFLIDTDQESMAFFKEPPVAGKLLLFPSSLNHGVEKCRSDVPRFTISFNAFPSGKISSHPGSLRFLNLNVRPYQEADSRS